MKKSIISFICTITLCAGAHAAGTQDLQEAAPDRYTVVEGDTLWSIAGRFLKDPWRWSELWKLNQGQIRNPNRIYPGDVLVLDRTKDEIQLQVERLDTVKLSPQARPEPLPARAVPSIPPTTIEPFLSRPLLVGQDDLADAPRIVGSLDARLTLGLGSAVYAEGIAQDKGSTWHIFRQGNALVDPDTRETLGYTAIFLGEARVRQFGAISILDITASTQEITVGDRLVPASREVPNFTYVPRAPEKPVKGRILGAMGNLFETGPMGVVSLSRGSRDGLEVGHVLAIYRDPETIRARPHTERLAPRDSTGAPRASEKVTQAYATKLPLPPQRYGLIMVFRTFDRAAFGIVMQASDPVAINDFVGNP